MRSYKPEHYKQTYHLDEAYVRLPVLFAALTSEHSHYIEELPAVLKKVHAQP